MKVRAKLHASDSLFASLAFWPCLECVWQLSRYGRKTAVGYGLHSLRQPSRLTEKEDPRDSSIDFFALRDASFRLGLDPREEFVRATELALPKTARILREFPYPWYWLNYPESLAMRLGWRPIKAHQTSEGFRYDPNSPVTKPEMSELVDNFKKMKDQRDA